MRFRIEYAPATISHLKALTARQQSIVLDGVARYLSTDPMVETRNRKPMRPNALAPWELGSETSAYTLTSSSTPNPSSWSSPWASRNEPVRVGKAVIDL